jgi:hypothetical protein
MTMSYIISQLQFYGAYTKCNDAADLESAVEHGINLIFSGITGRVMIEERIGNTLKPAAFLTSSDLLRPFKTIRRAKNKFVSVDMR